VIPTSLDSPSFRSVWSEWVVFRKQKKACKDWDKLFEKQLQWLSQFTQEQAIESLNNSMRNDYQGLFPPKNHETNQRNPPKSYDRNEGTLNQGQSYDGAAKKFKTTSPNTQGLPNL